jgi:hypothetical protein
LLLDRRPVLAGACLALLTIKPHLGLAAPFALVAGRKWRAIVATAVGAALMLAAAHLAFGAGIWTAFRDSIRLSSNIFAADADFWALYTTLYGAARMIGAPFWLAALFHACIAAVVLWLLVRIWRSPRVAPDMKAAVFCYALAIVTPRMLHYDMHILFIGALFQVRHALAHGFARWEKSALLLAAAVIFLFVFHARLPLLRLHALAAPILMFGCMAGRPELRRFFGLRREGAVEFN